MRHRLEHVIALLRAMPPAVQIAATFAACAVAVLIVLVATGDLGHFAAMAWAARDLIVLSIAVVAIAYAADARNAEGRALDRLYKQRDVNDVLRRENRHLKIQLENRALVQHSQAIRGRVVHLPPRDVGGA